MVLSPKPITSLIGKLEHAIRIKTQKRERERERVSESER